MNAGAWINKYEDHLLMVKNLSINTARAFVADARSFLRDGLRGADDWHAATGEATLEYVKLMKRTLKDTSIARKVYILKGFFKFLKREGVVTENPFEEMEFKRLNRALPQFLSIDEMNLLLNRIREPVTALAGLHQEDVMLTLRDRAMLEVLYSGGLRVSELVGLDWADVNLRRREVRVLGKGNKQRMCPLGQPAINALIEHAKYYEDYYNTKAEGPRPVFISSYHQRIVTRSIPRTIRKWADLAGLKKRIHPHSLRHSAATHMLENGADLRTVQQMLGHANISTTEIYTHVTTRKLRATHASTHPRA